jgi:hypothetical protein
MVGDIKNQKQKTRQLGRNRGIKTQLGFSLDQKEKLGLAFYTRSGID